MRAAALLSGLFLALTLPTKDGAAAGVGKRGSKAPEGMVLVPAGEFLMGSDNGNAEEGPAHRVRLSAFFIDRYEVTNVQFAEFVRKSGRYEEIEGPWFRYYAPGCQDVIVHYGSRDVAAKRAAQVALKAMPPGDYSRLPVRGVTWRDAAAYAQWAGKRLPTEAEWEKAARGAKGGLYPWGSDWKPERCRAGLEFDAGPVAVGSHPDGAGAYGSQDMAGNVWEWVADWYGETYYAGLKEGVVDPKGPEGLSDGRLPLPAQETDLLRPVKQGRETDTRKVIRGGGWSGALIGRAGFDVRTTRRLWSNPSYWHQDVGFRCAKDLQ